MIENKPTKVHKGRYKLKYRGTECRNCGFSLDISDKYCPNCSQANSIKKLSLKDFIDEFFATVIAYDSKLLKTLSALLFRPGKITKDYINGKRISYTNPFRFLLSLGIIYFLMLNFSGNLSQYDKYGANSKTNSISLADDFSFAEDLDLVNVEIEDEDTKKGLKVLDSLEFLDKIEQSEKKKDSIILANPKKHFKAINKEEFWKRVSAKRRFFSTLIEEKNAYVFKDIVTEYDIENSRENEFTFNAAKSFLHFKEQPGTFAHDLIAKLPFFIFFFLPIFTLFISLIYIREKYTYTDHLIFSFHNQSLLFILLTISYIVDNIFDTITVWIFMLVFSVYLYKSMRNFYGQGRFKTIVKYLFLNTVFFVLGLFGSIFLILGSIFTY